MIQERDHALLGPSSAKRWMSCPPSARLTETMPDSASTYAEEGTLAHELCELTLRYKLQEQMDKAAYDAAHQQIKAHALYNPEMEGCAEEYLQAVKETLLAYPEEPYLAVERAVRYDAFVPDGFGTADCLLIGGGVLHVIDYKHGKGVPVSATDNPQMKLYALGAMQEYALFYRIDTVRMTIVQPRLDNTSTAEITAADLNRWAVVEVKPKAKLAWEGKGDFASGDHCRFCQAKATCRHRAEENMALARHAFAKPPQLSNAEVGNILLDAIQLSAWVSDLTDYALHQCMAGELIDGWKVVEGQRRRTFVDAEAAFTAIKADGTDEALLYERKPAAFATLEKLLGKKHFAELLGDQIVKAPGKPTLVEETDKRPPYAKSKAEQAFGATEN